MKYVYSIPNGENWRQYATRAARYGAELRALGLAPEHPERVRARQAFAHGLREARRERRKFSAAARIIRAVAASKKKALVAA